MRNRVRVIFKGSHSAQLIFSTSLDAHGQAKMCEAVLRYHYEPAVFGKRVERTWGR